MDQATTGVRTAGLARRGKASKARAKARARPGAGSGQVRARRATAPGPYSSARARARAGQGPSILPQPPAPTKRPLVPTAQQGPTQGPPMQDPTMCADIQYSDKC